MLSWPSHKAMAVISTPAWSKCRAVVCRRTCGVTFLVRRFGHPVTALCVARWRRCATPSRERGRPRVFGKAVRHAKVTLDEVLHHRRGPASRGISRLLWARFAPRGELLAWGFGELAGGALAELGIPSWPGPCRDTDCGNHARFAHRERASQPHR